MFLILGGHVVFIILQNIWNFRGCERGGWVLLPHNLKHQPERWPPGQYTEYPVAAQGLAQQALLGGGSGIESGSKTDFYYHSCADEVADIIADTGFRTDLPNERAAFQNNRYGRGVYLADSPATALAERPGGTILKVSGNTACK